MLNDESELPGNVLPLSDIDGQGKVEGAYIGQGKAFVIAGKRV